MAEAGRTSGTKKSSRREAVNFGVLLILFIIYALTFTIAKFYDMINIVYPYAGVINFALLGVLFFNNVVFEKVEAFLGVMARAEDMIRLPVKKKIRHYHRGIF